MTYVEREMLHSFVPAWIGYFYLFIYFCSMTNMDQMSGKWEKTRSQVQLWCERASLVWVWVSDVRRAAGVDFRAPSLISVESWTFLCFNFSTFDRMIDLCFCMILKNPTRVQRSLVWYLIVGFFVLPSFTHFLNNSFEVVLLTALRVCLV